MVNRKKEKGKVASWGPETDTAPENRPCLSPSATKRFFEISSAEIQSATTNATITNPTIRCLHYT
eukprot:scaffold619_cov150-Skeletonema_menzelii.AAC.14